MAQQFLLTTTGTLSPIEFADIGSRSLVHPIVDLDMIGTEGFTLDELLASQDIRDAISAGYITVKDANGNPITDPDDLDQLAVEVALGGLTDVDLSGGPTQGETLTFDSGSSTWVAEGWKEDEFVPTNGQVTFFLSSAPTDTSSVSLQVNGVTADDGDDYTVSGVTLTWLDNFFTLETTDKLLVKYR